MATPNPAAAGATPMDLIWNDGVVPTWLAGMSLGFVLLFPILRALFPKSMKQEGAFLLAFELTCSVPVRDDSRDDSRARSNPRRLPSPLPPRRTIDPSSVAKPTPVSFVEEAHPGFRSNPAGAGRERLPSLHLPRQKNPSAFPLTRPPPPPSPFSRIALSWRRARITA